MVDEIDIATDLIDNELSRALEEIRRNSSQGIGAKFCIECDDPIPDARQQLGFKLCVSCAHEAERRKSLYAEDY